MKVYVARAYDMTHGRDCHKIGFSKNPETRARSMSDTFIGARFVRGTYPTIVHAIPAVAARRVESALHWLFRHKQIRGEWFTLDAQDLAWIARQTEKTILRAADAEWYRTCDLPKGQRCPARRYRVWRPTVPRQLRLFRDEDADG